MALLLACATVDGIWAQENSPWIGEPLPSEGGEFYLYNKVGNGFCSVQTVGVHRLR